MPLHAMRSRRRLAARLLPLAALILSIALARPSAAFELATHLGGHEAATDTSHAKPDTVKAKPSSDTWYVNQAHGPADTVRFEVHEGTWMSVDVSPDGKTLVFDLLEIGRASCRERV